MKKKILNLLKKRVVFLDGATGTQLQKYGMPKGASPEQWAIENPDLIKRVHSDYILAGSDIVYTSTFGGNRIKLEQYNIKDPVKVNKKLAQLAKAAVGKRGLVAGDIGPTGKFVKPFGTLKFTEAVEIFKEQVKGLLLGGVDLIVIETMMDIQEARAALIAVKETVDIFTMVTMTYEKSRRTLNGNDPLSSLITLQSLGADAIGCNCSSGPANMCKIISSIKPFAKIPLIAKPNAGLPKLINNKTVFSMKARGFASACQELTKAGVNFIGGCCGTTPEHISLLRKNNIKLKPKKIARKTILAISSARRGLVLEGDNNFNVIGEKINPTGKKKLQKELLEERYFVLRQIASLQEKNKATALDVNLGVGGIDEIKAMKEAISLLAVSTDLPLVIDSSNPEVIESALRFYPGRALINSISGEKGKMERLLPLVKKYGAMFILLPLTKTELPLTFKERKENIKKLLKKVKLAGLSVADIVVDALVLTFSSNPKSPIETLKTIKWCSEELKCNTVIGLSNISFGLPNRRLVNRVFLSMARNRGLTLAIADPIDKKATKSKLASDLLLNKDRNGEKFITKYSDFKPISKTALKDDNLSPEEKVYSAILDGNKQDIKDLINQALIKGLKPLFLMQEVLVKAIMEVGDFFDVKKYFLPQLISSAEAMKQGVALLEPMLDEADRFSKKKAIVLMATVEGDIHDIGKNIVNLMLKNQGFEIFDLGKDVSAQKIVKAIKLHNPDIVGLSALMTTTMVNMKDIIELARKEKLSCSFMVGGAVLSKTYADTIGAEYAKDGVAAVRLAEKITKTQTN